MTSVTPDSPVAERRDAVIAEHIAAECAHDVPRALKTFSSPHYYVYPFALDASGAEAVTGLLGALFDAFPDFQFVPERTYHADEAVIVEGRMIGTHNGVWAGVSASGNTIDVPTCSIYHFDGDNLTRETVYFDHGTLLNQIGATR
jgi:steroid delta-isomerase-like uncharacterized protein